VHIHHPVVLGRIALRESRRRGVPVVATAHSDYLHYLESYAWRPSRPAFYAYGRSVMRSTFNACETVMAPSQSITRKLESWGVASRIVAVDYAVDPHGLPSVACGEARHRLGLDGGPLAFYAGRLAPEKRLAELIAEFRRVHDAVPQARLAIAGDGPSRPRLHEMIVAQGLAGAVLPLGPLGHSELGLWYSAANLYVSASSNEVGPLTAIEAQLCGTPVVAYRAPGFEDRVETGRTGLLAENRPGELAAAMIGLLEDPVRAERMGADAQHSARLRYDSGRVVRQLLAVYDAVRR
jgi:1,2-diacylglycerol 3-alpha-glucosyltransferase